MLSVFLTLLLKSQPAQHKMFDGEKIQVVIAHCEVLFIFVGFLEQRIALVGPRNEELGP